MEIAIIVFLVIVIAALSANTANDKKKLNQSGSKDKKDIDYTKGYKSKWMFSTNEKDAYNKIKGITDELGLYLFAKVRLYDLIEPKQGIENRQAHQFKIQAKHVDFVICDKKLVARAVIEYDDASHDNKAREERDIFIDTVLTNCGYKVLHMRSVEVDKLKEELSTIFSKVAVSA